MSRSEQDPMGDDRDEVAAAWVVRLEADEPSEPDILAFDAWVSASRENARAFDRALSVSLEYRRNSDAASATLGRRRQARPVRRQVWFGVGAAMAAALGTAVVLSSQFHDPDPDVYVTGVGERRTVRLADGSTVDMNAATRLSVTLHRTRRELVLDEGEAIFDVAHDPRRPFEIVAGDTAIRVVGTQFDVRWRRAVLAVTVARGAVEVRPSHAATGRAYRLRPGQRLEHHEGASDIHVAAVDAQEVLGWRAGRLVYRDQPLSQVVDDLNHHFPTPIHVEDPTLAATPISGVLMLDDQTSVIRRLALLVPVSAVPSGTGLVLRREGASGP